MAKRITIVIQDDVNKKLRKIHAKRIKNKKPGEKVSFSHVLNEELRKAFSLTEKVKK